MESPGRTQRGSHLKEPTREADGDGGGGPGGPIRVLLLIEGVVFPVVFLGFAAHLLWSFLKPIQNAPAGQKNLLGVSMLLLDLAIHAERRPPGLSFLQILDSLAFGMVRQSVLFFFNLMCAIFIAFRRHLRYAPSSLREVLIPLGGTFTVLLVTFSRFLPPGLRTDLKYAKALILPMSTLGVVLALGGALLALWGLLYLRRNFSVFVEVREVVLSGPYRFVRHPLYAGEVLMMLGVLAITPSIFGIAVAIIFVTLQVWRARMEEVRLAAASPAYQERLGRTGMFFPKVR